MLTSTWLASKYLYIDQGMEWTFTYRFLQRENRRISWNLFHIGHRFQYGWEHVTKSPVFILWTESLLQIQFDHSASFIFSDPWTFFFIIISETMLHFSPFVHSHKWTLSTSPEQFLFNLRILESIMPVFVILYTIGRKRVHSTKYGNFP